MSTVTRRSASALIASAASLVSTAINAGSAIDPVYGAIEAWEVAHKAEQIVAKRHADLERNHREAMFPPAVPLIFPAIAKQPAFAQARTPAEIDRFFDAWSRSEAPAVLDAHRARTHAELEAALDRQAKLRREVGAAAIEAAYSAAEDALMDAEFDALSTVPTTLAGAAALAAFAARIRKGEQAPRSDDDKYLIAFRGLSAFLSRSA